MLATQLLFLSPLMTLSDASPTSSAWGDVNRDGLQDFYVTDARRGDRLFRNQGDGRFEDVTEQAGLAGNLGTRAAAWSDFDQDDNLDLLVLTAQGDLRLYRGVGDGYFQVANAELGIEAMTGALEAEWNDYDADGWNDIVLQLEGGAPLFLHSQAGQAFERFEPDLGPVLVEEGTGVFSMTVVDRTADAPADGTLRDTDGPRYTPGQGRVSIPPTGPSGAGAGDGSAATTSGAAGTAFGDAAMAICSDRIVDQATSSCITASSDPAVGSLYPLSQDLCVEPSGDVGMGTVNPLSNLQVVGDSSLGKLQVSPDIGINGDSMLLLSEEDDGRLGMAFKYTGGSSNHLQVVTSSSAGVESGPWLSIDRQDGAVGIGTDDIGTASTGDIRQPLAGDGLLKAAAHIVGGVSPSVSRQFNHIPDGSTISVSRLATGQYQVNFGSSVDLTTRFYIAQVGNSFASSPTAGSISVTPRSGNPGSLYVRTTDEAGVDIENSFYILVY